MNIVKGVADLIRRTSTGQNEESASGSQAGSFCPPGPRIRFSEIGDEAVLKALWERFEKAADKVDKRRAFLVFLKQFLVVYKKWEPDNFGQLSDAASTSIPLAELPSHFGDVVIGCFAGHPAEIIWTLSEELKQITALVTDLSTSLVRSAATDFSCPSATLSITSEGVFGYYGGIQKLIALMKGSVVQLKSISGALCADENLSSITVEKASLLQQILVFIELNSNVYENSQLYNNSIGFILGVGESSVDSSSSLNVPSETMISWHQKAVVSVMEAGGLNWLVDTGFVSELLRVVRRLSMREQEIDFSLHHLALRILRSALFDNPRGQNHFKSIGGLEVLLDGLGLPPNNNQMLMNSTCAVEKRVFIKTLQHCILVAFRKVLVTFPLSLDVFREEGIWELIFSESFFYFGPTSEDASAKSCTYNESLTKNEVYSTSHIIDNQAKSYGVDILQRELISFLEFAATLSGSAHNLG
ncbi:hypothetical protein F8388_017676 [Cannabis sativa]|uniref:Uncharacterized protein n=1 Tax=Cannabis sativa TaxID=3483 RepID=A0A7J6HJU3_CANSA|nr:hypothetical protein F8388_017676 [Cannabis sativa]